MSRYQILATYDLAQINRELGTNYANLAQVNRACREAFDALTPHQRHQDAALCR